MKGNQNLWIGLVIGAGLTGILMYVLYQQTGPNIIPPAIEKTTIPEAPFVKAKPAAPNKTQELPVTQTKKPKDIDLPGLPKNPSLPEEELNKLSASERKRYEEVLKTYHQVRNKVLKLHQEREQLQQKMDKIIEENTTIDQQLDEMRQEQNKH